MKFGAMYLSGLLWIFPIMLFFYIWSSKRKKVLLGRFAHQEVLREISRTVIRGRKKVKAILILVSIALMLFAALRPQWGFSWQEVKRRGLDIIIAVDTSNSMLAEDVLPNRLKRSKLAIEDLVKKLKGDRVGLIAFSGTAFLQCPLTSDYNGFLLSLDDLSVNTIPVGGTSLSNAIYTAINSFEGGEEENKVLVIITDGEDLEGGVDKAILRAKGSGVSIYCIGVGTQEGEIIPIHDDNGKLTFLKDREGNIVKTRLSEEVLQKAALSTGGMYVRSTGTEFGLELIYEQRLSRLEKEDIKSRMEKKYKERFQLPLIIVLVLLFIEPFVGDRRRNTV